jgi:arabinan endo-1,5-alpha-L-arabinosidase
VRVTPTKSNGATYQVAFDPSDTAMEGPNVFKNGDFYYLFFSKGTCCGYDNKRPAAGKEYRILACRSSSPARWPLCRQGRQVVPIRRWYRRSPVTKLGVWARRAGRVSRPDQRTRELPAFRRFVLISMVGSSRADNFSGFVLSLCGYSRRFWRRPKKFGWNRINFSSGWPVV